MEEMSIRARIVKALGETNEAEFAQIIEGIHPADMAEVLETFVAEERSAFFEKIDPELAADILVEFDEEERGELVAPILQRKLPKSWSEIWIPMMLRICFLNFRKT